MLLVAIPVLGMTVGSIAVRTTNEPAAAQFAREYGAADLAFVAGGRVAFDEVDGEFTVSDAESPRSFTFADGTRAISNFSVSSVIRGVDSDGMTQRPYATIVDVDVADPLATELFVVDVGRLPIGESEVLLDDELADRFDVGIGDTLRLTRPEMSLAVVGIGRAAAQTSDLMLIPGFDRSLVQPGFGSVDVLVDLPDQMSVAEMDGLTDGLRRAGLQAQTPTQPLWFGQDDLDTKTLAWGWVAGVVAFMAVGIVIAAAFATSATRQLVTIGQLSSNGAPERLVRRTLGLQGLWTGVLGAVLGLAVGVIGMQFSVPLLEIVGNRPFSGVRISGVDLFVIGATALGAATLAALIPARSASRVPVLAALAGRRPMSSPPSWLVPTGIALFAGGLFLLGGAASDSDGGDFAAAMAVVGGVGVLFGIACCSPLIVSIVGRVGAGSGGITRLASRSLSRSRARSAGVMTAIATVTALAVAGLTSAGSVQQQDQFQGGNQSIVTLEIDRTFGPPDFDANGNFIEVDLPPLVPPELSAQLRADLETVLPDARWIALTGVIEDPITNADYPQDGDVIRPVIATDQVVELADLNDAEIQRLSTDGVVVTAPWLTRRLFVSTTSGLIEIDGGEILREPVIDANGNFTNPPGLRVGSVFITETFAEEMGFDLAVQRYIIDNPTNLTRQQRSTLDQLRPFGSGPDSFVAEASADGGAVPGEGTWYFYFDRPSTDIAWPLIQLIVLAVALMAVLLVVAIGLSLAATESRDERDVLHTVGASPSVLRRVAAVKAWVLTTGAAVVAIPAGYTVVRVVTWVNDDSAPVPWIGIIGVLVFVPTLTASATLLVSAIAQRLRPITVSTMTLD